MSRPSLFSTIVGAALVMLIAAGCAQPEVSVGRIGGEYLPRDKNHELDIFVEPSSSAEILEAFGTTSPISNLPRDATLIGRIDASGKHKWPYLVEPVEKRAREIGGDAITVEDAVRQRAYRSAAWEDKFFRSMAVRVWRYRDRDAETSMP